ncbi:IclR family transcriptional regulator [Sinorhizobium alkalisoli]|uniref:IclR family transcriptional regulator n=1 Tax=Sinorhizobium alkalisoli TaxID=1752398 RepID=UPI000B273D3A|nr:helix-turn-helix domain-containing protein [Sinorhizobium alkalisoli]MCA1490726.1 helix-turn-helix domain-containing protein [Ensifer sp. NBAIM29]
MIKEKQDTLFVGSLEKGMRILSVFDERHSALGLTEIAALTGLDKSAAQRLTNTLHKIGYLNKDPESRRYRPSLKFLELGNAYLWSDPLVQLAMPKLIELGRKLGERVNVARLDGHEIVYVIRIPTQLTSFGAMISGRRLSALTTSSGRAMIACFAPEERKKAVETWPITALTSKTTLDRAKIAAAIEEAAACGYGLTQSENILNEIGIAAPILAGDRRPVATVQCSVSSLKWSIEKVRSEIAPHLIEVANSIHLP